MTEKFIVNIDWKNKFKYSQMIMNNQIGGMCCQYRWVIAVLGVSQYQV